MRFFVCILNVFAFSIGFLIFVSFLVLEMSIITVDRSPISSTQFLASKRFAPTVSSIDEFFPSRISASTFNTVQKGNKSKIWKFDMNKINEEMFGF